MTKKSMKANIATRTVEKCASVNDYSVCTLRFGIQIYLYPLQISVAEIVFVGIFVS